MATNIITPKFIEKMRSSDYQGTSYAFAEIIDNSFDAEATIVRIVCLEKKDGQGKRYIDEIIFADNGTGMTDHILNNCLTFAYGTNEDLGEVMQKKKIGKFGMGLPNSSISQCKHVEVFSKTEDSVWRSKTLDIDSLVKSGLTELQDIEETQLPAYYKQNDIVVDELKGTIVSWKICDQLDRQFGATLLQRAEVILGRLFRYHLANGCRIEMAVSLHSAEDNSWIKSWALPGHVSINDPMFLTPNAFITKALRESSAKDEGLDEKHDPATYFQPFIAGLLENESRPTNERLEDYSYVHRFEWKQKQYSFRIKTSYANKDIQKPGIREGGKTRVGNIYGEKLKNGNIYFTRHSREISAGHYGFYNLSAENSRWWTVEVDFDADADQLMGVSNTKQGIKFSKTFDEESFLNFDKHTASLQQAREKLWHELSNRISKAIAAASKKLSEQAQQFENQIIENGGGDGNLPLPTSTDTTTQAIKQTDKQRKGRFDEDQKNDLIDALTGKFPDLPIEGIERAVDRFDRSLVRGCIIYCPTGDDQLWSYNDVRNFLVIFINTNHGFYKNIIAQFRSTRFESALTAIELFISSLAWEQSEHFDTDESKKRNLDNFRTLVGMHLNNYLEENDIKVTLDDIENFKSDEVV